MQIDQDTKIEVMELTGVLLRSGTKRLNPCGKHRRARTPSFHMAINHPGLSCSSLDTMGQDLPRGPPLEGGTSPLLLCPSPAHRVTLGCLWSSPESLQRDRAVLCGARVQVAARLRHPLSPEWLGSGSRGADVHDALAAWCCRTQACGQRRSTGCYEGCSSWLPCCRMRCYKSVAPAI